jgi:hypothetical protein
MIARRPLEEIDACRVARTAPAPAREQLTVAGNHEIALSAISDSLPFWCVACFWARACCRHAFPLRLRPVLAQDHPVLAGLPTFDDTSINSQHLPACTSHRDRPTAALLISKASISRAYPSLPFAHCSALSPLPLNDVAASQPCPTPIRSMLHHTGPAFCSSAIQCLAPADQEQMRLCRNEPDTQALISHLEGPIN